MYKHFGCDAMVLHVTSMVLDKLFGIASNPDLKKVHWLALVYLASTPAASQFEIRAYLKHFHGLKYGKGEGIAKLNLIALVRAGLAEKVVIQELNHGKPLLRITPEGKKLVA